MAWIRGTLFCAAIGLLSWLCLKGTGIANQDSLVPPTSAWFVGLLVLGLGWFGSILVLPIRQPQFVSIMRFAWEQRKPSLIALAVSIAGVGGLGLYRGWPFSLANLGFGADGPVNFWEWAQVAITIATFFVGVVIWYGEVRAEWIASLPKRLTVDYQVEGKTIMYAQHIPLSGASEIRAWAQQLGAQMAGGQLAIRPYFTITPRGPRSFADTGYVEYFEMTLPLANSPAPFAERLQIARTESQCPDAAWCWYAGDGHLKEYWAQQIGKEWQPLAPQPQVNIKTSAR